MIFSGSSKIKEVFYGDTRIKEVYAGADLVWKRITDTVKFANGWDVDFRKAAPEGFKSQPRYSATIRADKDGFYDFHTTGPSGRLYLYNGHEEFAIIPLTRGNGGVRVFVRHTDLISFIFNEKKYSDHGHRETVYSERSPQDGGSELFIHGSDRG